MATADSLSSTTPSATPKGGRGKKSKIVILRLEPDVLERFPATVPAAKVQKSRTSLPSSTQTKIEPPSDTPTPVVDEAATEAASETNNGDNGTENGTPAQSERKRPGPKPKRGLTADGQPKPRGKPGPKKKPRLPDGTIDHSGDTPRATNTAGAPSYKLNPKANQGAINANLRALDRTGKPCRKWQKKGLQLKSFTGVQWHVGTWGANGPSTMSSTSANMDSTETSENKQISSGASEEKSNQDQDIVMADAPRPDSLAPMTAVGA